MKTVAIESPYAGNIAENLMYLDECILNCLDRGETPYASHKMLTTALDDSDPKQRINGIFAGMVMSASLDKRVFYIDLGWSKGMKAARDYYDEHNLWYEIRKIRGSE